MWGDHMKTSSLAYLLGALFIAYSSSALGQTQEQPVRNIMLTEPRDISDAAAVHYALGVLGKDVESCNPSSRGTQACVCSFKVDLKKLKDAYNAAVAKHPDLKEQATVVAYVDPANGQSSVTVVFHNIKRQLASCSEAASKAK